MVCLSSVTSFLSDSLRSQDCSPSGCSVYGDSPGKNTGVGHHALFQGIELTSPVSPALQADSLPLSHWVHGVPVCLGKMWQPCALVLCPFSSPTYWKDQASRAVFVAHSLIHLFEFSSCHWPVVVFQKQSMVKFKVIGQGSWWSKVNISIVFSDIEAEFEERQIGRPSDSDGLKQLLPSSASLAARVLWVWDLGNP